VVHIVCLGFIKIILLLVRLEGRFNFLLKESLPVIVAQPDVALDLSRTMEAKAITRLALQALVYEIGGLD